MPPADAVTAKRAGAPPVNGAGVTGRTPGNWLGREIM
jgi:hypothetical protein